MALATALPRGAGGLGVLVWKAAAFLGELGKSLRWDVASSTQTQHQLRRTPLACPRAALRHGHRQGHLQMSSSRGGAPCRYLWGPGLSSMSALRVPSRELATLCGALGLKSLGPTFLVTHRKNATRPYSSLPGEAVFANGTGMLVVAFGLLVLYVLQASSWKRPEVGITTEGQVRALVSPARLGEGWV